MNPPTYRMARALYPHRRDVWELEEAAFLYEPLPPPPIDHPELGLFGPGAGGMGAAGEWNGLTRDANGEGNLGGDEGARMRAGPRGRLDEPMPARMLNEHVYCPRLFYYEYVEGVFVESEDTERGTALHKKVDKGRGELAPVKRGKGAAAEEATREVRDSTTALAEGVKGGSGPEGEGPPGCVAEGAVAGDAGKAGTTPPREKGTGVDVVHSRSATLGSERLGVVAKMDLIEVELTSELQSTPALARAKRGKAGAASEGDLFAAPGPGIIEVVAPGRRVIQRVTPVDYKKGAPRALEDGNVLWDADKMQLGLQILILRDNGYVCDEGMIYYRETKQRVGLVMTADLEGWIVGQIAAARETAAGKMPPPLVNSPKCVRCSLAPVCLPDETRLLAEAKEPVVLPNQKYETDDGGESDWRATLPRAEKAPRRLMAARDDERALYLNTQGCRVTLRGEVLVVKDEGTVLGEYRLREVSHVGLFGNIQVTTQALHCLCEAEVPVAYFSLSGWFYGLTRGHGLKNVFTRMEQFEAARDERRCLALAQRFVHGKIRNHRTQLMRNHVNLPEGVSLKMKRAAGDVLMARNLPELLGMEGAVAAMYFQNFAGMIKASAEDDEIPGLEAPMRPEKPMFSFEFKNRNRRPPTDPVNALLSLAYSLLAKDCTLALLAVGFDPYVGFFHQPRFGRPALALDLMEEFRPLVAESAVLTALNNRMVAPGHFVQAGEAVNLTVHGRKAFFQAYEQRMGSLITHPVFDYKVSYRRVLELQARMLARYLTGEIAEYVPMMTR